MVGQIGLEGCVYIHIYNCEVMVRLGQYISGESSGGTDWVRRLCIYTYI